MYKPKTTKRIQNLSRAINKLDPRLKGSLLFAEHRIEDVEMGINTVKYRQDGVRREIRYSDLEQMKDTEQAALLSTLSVERYELRQERALEQIKTKGKISWQFKRSLEKDNKQLLDDILEFERTLDGNTKEAIQNEFKELDIESEDSWLDESENYFQGPNGSPAKFDFYRPDMGASGGFNELNTFTWNTYKVLKGI